ncbi:MAG: SDR family NAD(P)-dependent oxidoreductase [Gammaproteobacteria bacterium]|nr:SDR family NAD(P)-dependent oxidoreductase [Gammaproteobacteria bacterium]MCY4218874.1 SDR family NAD(P)-dependent oxidoreductase [Gammaproteobacteria bacterium]MCY4274258.1 SDR family NAD(P)-dependent oxidoreductase [Gammaproteobacteria bacterium]
MDIQNKVAVITGATGGIGLAMANYLIGKKIRAIGLVDRSDECLDIADSLKNTSGHPNIKPFCGNVCDNDFRKSVFNTLKSEFGPVEICVTAAGILRDGLAVQVEKQSGNIELYSDQQFRQVIEVNLMHPIYWSMETIAGIASKQQQQRIDKWNSHMGIQGVNIMIGSVSSRGNRGQISYASAKSGLRGACTTLNKEGLRHGVLTKIVHPGFVDTPMVDQVDVGYFDKHLKPDIGLGRKIHPQEIAECIGSMIENDPLTGEVWASASFRPFA